MGKRELVASLCLSSWCLVIIGWLFHALPWVCLQFVIVVFPDHTHFLRFNCGFYFALVFSCIFVYMFYLLLYLDLCVIGDDTSIS